jgi:hypothetical protein
MVLGRTDIMLKTTVEFGLIRLVTLILSVRYGLDCTAFSYNLAVLLYSPRSLMLVLPIVGGTLASYARLIAAPVAITLISIVVFREITQVAVVNEWGQLFLGGILGVAGIAASALAQREILQEEMTLLKRAAA